MLSGVLAACSSNEVVRVGVPFADGSTEGIHYHKDVTDYSSVNKLRMILHSEKKVESLETLSVEPQAVFTVDFSDDDASEVRRYVWYRENGRAIMSNKRHVLSTKDDQEFYRLTTKQTSDLMTILN